jgi:glutamine synthetase
MVGSSSSIAEPNTILNTIVAEILSEFADKLETSENFHDDLFALLKETIVAHKRIIFNGNNYAEDWVTDAEARGLSNLKTTIEALPALVTPKSIEVLTKHKVLAEEEIHSRYEIMLENYCKTVHIEALTMVDMVRQEVFPAVIAYEKELANLIDKKSGKYNITLEDTLLTKLSDLAASASLKLEALEASLLDSKNGDDNLALASFYRYTVFNNMSELRLVVDEMETLVSKDRWPYPSYGDLLFSVLH